MSFIPETRRIVPGSGSKTAPICIIGEAPGAEEDRLLKPFVGHAGTVLDACLHAAQVVRGDCYITNVIKVRPRGNDIAPYYNAAKGTFTDAGKEWLEQLYEELAGVRSNVLVPLGGTALAAVAGHRSISKYRGYVMQAVPRLGGRKAIPAYHPAAALRGQYILRYYITADFEKAKRECSFPEIRRPNRRIVVPDTLQECHNWIEYLKSQPMWACDIEVVNFQVSAIGFAPSPELAISIPMYHEHWTESEEVALWRMLNELLTGPAIKVFQNGIFDCHFLAARSGIVVAPPIEDTMIAHSVMYPEMLKGLEFLVSIHCGSQQYYKDMVKWDNIKKEA